MMEISVMDKTTIEQELNRIKEDLAAVLRQDCDDIDSFDFIKLNASVLKTRIHSLKEKIGMELDHDNECKMAYQKLYNTLQRIEASLRFKMPLNPTVDDIKHQLALIKACQKDIKHLL
jgi:hypothetical protein